MFCQKCGAQCADGVAFCQKCGALLNQSAVLPQQSAQAEPQPGQQQPIQQPVQQPYAQPQQPYGMPQQPMYYGVPAKQPMSKGVLAALISAGVIIVALVAVLLVVLLGGDTNDNRRYDDDDDPSVTESTKKTSKTEKTQKTQKTQKNEPDAPVRSKNYEDLAEELAELLETGDVDTLIDHLPDEAVDYIVMDNGYSGVREWKTELEESFAELAETGEISCRVGGYWEVYEGDYDEIVEFYDDVLGLEVESAILVGIEQEIEYYYEEEWDSYTEEFYLVEIDGVWYIEGIELFS